MKSRNLTAGILALSLFILGQTLTASANTRLAFDSSSMDPSGSFVAGVANSSTVSYTATVPAGATGIVNSDIQLQRFVDPGLSSPTKTQVGNSVLLTKGSFSVLVTAAGVTLNPADLSMSFITGNSPIPDYIAVLVASSQGMTGSISYEFGPGSLTRDSSGTPPFVVIQSRTSNSSLTYFVTKNYSGGGSTPSPRAATPAAPIKYSGPEFTELNQKPALSGTSVSLAGRKLNEISTITVDGKAAKFSDATDKSLKLELPAGLKPGVYDLVVTTASHGKLTHMNAIRIREEFPPTSLTIRGTGVLSGEEFKKLTAFARTQNPEMNTVTCIVNSGSEGKSFTMARALCGRIAQNNLNIKTTQLEVRSTVESSAVFARVVFSSVQ
jgi:hypothetical protein